MKKEKEVILDQNLEEVLKVLFGADGLEYRKANVKQQNKMPTSAPVKKVVEKEVEMPTLKYGDLVEIEGIHCKITMENGKLFVYYKESGEKATIIPVSKLINGITKVYTPANAYAIHSYNPENFKLIWEKEEPQKTVLTLDEIRKVFNLPKDAVIVVEGVK